MIGKWLCGEVQQDPHSRYLGAPKHFLHCTTLVQSPGPLHPPLQLYITYGDRTHPVYGDIWTPNLGVECVPLAFSLQTREDQDNRTILGINHSLEERGGVEGHWPSQ